MRKYVGLALSFYAAIAGADTQVAKIVGFVPSTNAATGKEILVFKLENGPSGGCNTSGRYAIDTSSLHFKATEASIIAAFHAQVPVYVGYSQTCNVFSNAWDAAYVCTGSNIC